jgi:DNA-binding MarR family transcriptional regulator
MTQFEIGNDAKVTSAHVTYLIDSLEEDGLAVRSPHPTDRRMMHVELSPQGIELCDRLVPAMARFMSDVVSDLTQEEKVVMNRLLARVRRNAEAMTRNER